MSRSRRIAAAAWIVCAGLGWALSADSGDEEDRFRAVIVEHLQSYPGMEVRDIYKLVYQAAMGAEHAAPDRTVARRWLEQEIASLPEASPEPLIRPLSADGSLVRVDLRTYLASDGDLESLLDAFLGTAERVGGSHRRLRRLWGYVESMASDAEIPFASTDLQAFYSEMESQGFPAVRHSDLYKQRYKPAYRVVWIALLVPDVATEVPD